MNQCTSLLRLFLSRRSLSRISCPNETGMISVTRNIGSCTSTTVSKNENPGASLYFYKDPTKGIQQSWFHSSLKYNYDGKGQDLLGDSLSFGTKRKIILDSYYPNTGIDVLGMLESSSSLQYNKDSNSSNDDVNKIHMESYASKPLLMNSSIVAFPYSCYLWKPKTVKEITLESLSIVQLCQPPMDYLFIGSDSPMPPRELNRIKKEMGKSHIVVEQLDVMNAMGTFNILNGEDRRVAVAILIQED